MKTRYALLIVASLCLCSFVGLTVQADDPAPRVDHATATATLGERLGTVGRPHHAEGATKKKSAKTVDKAGSAKSSASRSSSAAGKPRSVTARKECRTSR